MAFYEPIPALPVTRLVTCRVAPCGIVAADRVISKDLFIAIDLLCQLQVHIDSIHFYCQPFCPVTTGDNGRFSLSVVPDANSKPAKGGGAARSPADRPVRFAD
jgi:hypothetical protein